MLFFHQRMQLRRQILPHFGHMNIGCLFGILLSLASCNQIPSQRPLEEGSVNLRSAFAAAQTGQNDEVVTNWLQSFQDPQLTRAVQTALANNQDLQSAAILLKSARQGTIIGRASRLPTLNASGNSSLSRSNGETNDSYGFSLNASWEPDVWGRLRDLEVASVADYHAAVADYRSARLSLAINTAQSWCDLITAESQLTLAVETLKSFRKNYQIIQRGYKLGTLRPLDDAFGRSNVADAEGSLKSSQLARDEAARNLQILMGQYPDAKLISAFELPRTPRVRAGLPSGLLARRPDLTARRLDILASAKVADAERKELLPSFQLSASSGSSSSQLRDLLDPANLATSLAASIAQSLYSGGRLTANAQQALANNESQIKLYERDVLNAFREVESALATDESLKKQEEFLLTEVENTALAEKWAESNFVEGLDVGNRPSILEVLEAQQRALNARASLIILRNNRLQNHLDLLLALGGSI